MDKLIRENYYLSGDVALAPHCPFGPIALASCLQVDAVCYNGVLQEQSIGIHYNVGKSVLDYIDNKEDFRFAGGFVNLPVKRGAGILPAPSDFRHCPIFWRCPVFHCCRMSTYLCASVP